MKKVQGSPPHVRGKQAAQIAPMAKMRITPACAGKTRRNFVQTDELRDHPRMCGENPSVPFLRVRI